MNGKQAAIPAESRTASRAAWLLCGLTLALIACTAAFALLTSGVWGAIRLLALVSSALVGGMVASRQPTNHVGWFLLISTACFAVAFLAEEYTTYGQPTEPGSLPLARAMAWLPQWLWAPGAVLILLFLPLYFPDGRLISRRWRWVVRFAVFFSAFVTISSAFQPGDGQDLGFANPLGVEALGFLSWVLDVAIVPLWLGLLFLSAASLVVRFRRSGIEQRQQIKLLAFATSLIPLWFIVSSLIQQRAPVLFHIADTLALAGVPVAVGIAVLKYHLYDIDLIINRTVAYAALTACVVGFYVLIVGYLGAVFNARGDLAISLVATGVVAVLFQPLRERIQRAVNRLMYGERDDPYTVLTRLGQRLEATLAPDAVLTTIVETTKEALKLPYAAIEMTAGDPFESSIPHPGSPLSRLLRLPLTYQNGTVGHLVLAPRSPDEPFSSADLRLLHHLARQAGIAVHAVRLTTDLQRLNLELQRARERLVATREEERRRIRRDLHDGVGPTLASLVQRLDAARTLVPEEPEAAVEMLSDLKGQVKQTIVEIRRLVYALRPPVLDEFGLLSAIQEHAVSYSQPGGLCVRFDAPASLPPLPAAIEVATYRIVQEALANVVRHAQAQQCVIRLALDDRALTLAISDDGQGLPLHSRIGVGLTSMRERAEELGGTLAVESEHGQGTTIRARLPLPQER